MANGWQVYRIGDLLTQNFNNVKVAPENSYKLLGVRLEGRGAFLREEKTGDSISANTLSPVHAGDFIYSRLFAWRGAFDVVSEELNGCFVSGEFPTFKVNTEKLLPKFLQLYFDRSAIWEEVEKYCTGTTKASRNRFKEQFFLGFEIPLPPLMEQRRIVRRIEALAGRVAEAQSLRREASEEVESLIGSALIRVFELSKAPKMPLKSVSHYQRGRFSWRPRNDPRFYDGEYPFIQIGDIPRTEKYIKSHTQTLNGEGLAVSRLFSTGTIVISIAATIGAVGILGFDSCMPDSLVGITADINKALPDYVYYFLKYSQAHFERIAPQSAQKNINIRILDEVKIPVPPLEEQRRLVAYLDGLQAQVSALRAAQTETGKELSALMPSVLDKAFKGEL